MKYTIPTLKLYLKSQPTPKLKYKGKMLTQEERSSVYEQRMEGMKIEYLAAVFEVSISTIVKVIKEYHVKSTSNIKK